MLVEAVVLMVAVLSIIFPLLFASRMQLEGNNRRGGHPVEW